MKHMKVCIKTGAYILLQCTWGFLQTALGLLLFLRFIRSEHTFYHGCIKTRVDKRLNISLGLFIFVTRLCDDERAKAITRHEYGHTVQSLWLGPLYLWVVGLPSIIWCNLPYFRKMRETQKIPYAALWVESWADKLGEKWRGADTD